MGREPIIGLAQLSARVIVGRNPDTGNWQVKCIPLDRVAVVPYDGEPPEGAGGNQ